MSESDKKSIEDKVAALSSDKSGEKTNHNLRAFALFIRKNGF